MVLVCELITILYFALQAGCSMLGAWGTSVSSKDSMIQVQ
jgi:hypothetical protein